MRSHFAFIGTCEDDRNGADYGEERWIVIVLLTSHTTAVVVYVEETEDTIRIISARKEFFQNQRQQYQFVWTGMFSIGLKTKAADIKQK